ncbi:hypothetical protein [Microbacterium esteraromaticum]|nr:hypothetical protein [Microbacterium esteraromaticum]
MGKNVSSETMSVTPGISRRSLVKGAAWAAPAIVAAAYAPLAAASTTTVPPTPVFHFASACKNPGNSSTGCTGRPMQSYQVRVTVTNTTAETQILRFTGFRADTTNAGVAAVHTYSASAAGQCAAALPRTTACGTPGGIELAPGATLDAWIVSGSAGSSGAGLLHVDWSWHAKSTCATTSSGTSSGSPSGLSCPSR